MAGVIAAGEFSKNGELIDYVGDISLKAAKTAALISHANYAASKMQAVAWSNYTGKSDFEPSIGFAVSGPKKSALVVKNIGVFVDNNKIDFDNILSILKSM